MVKVLMVIRFTNTAQSNLLCHFFWNGWTRRWERRIMSRSKLLTMQVSITEIDFMDTIGTMIRQRKKWPQKTDIWFLNKLELSPKIGLSLSRVHCSILWRSVLFISGELFAIVSKGSNKKTTMECMIAVAKQTSAGTTNHKWSSLKSTFLQWRINGLY